MRANTLPPDRETPRAQKTTVTVTFNDAAQEMLGPEAEKVIESDIADVLVRQHRADQLRRLAETGGAVLKEGAEKP